MLILPSPIPATLTLAPGRGLHDLSSPLQYATGDLGVVTALQDGVHAAHTIGTAAEAEGGLQVLMILARRSAWTEGSAFAVVVEAGRGRRGVDPV